VVPKNSSSTGKAVRHVDVGQQARQVGDAGHVGAVAGREDDAVDAQPLGVGECDPQLVAGLRHTHVDDLAARPAVDAPGPGAASPVLERQPPDLPELIGDALALGLRQTITLCVVPIKRKP
jgi:hypothetical protein